MELLHTLLAFAVAIALLIVVHELGHYWAAKRCGVKVLRFSVGMGKVIFSRRLGRDRTEWALSVVPIGGYVKMLDAREQGAEAIPAAERHREFTAQPVWKRMIIVAAGPLANFLLAIILFSCLYMYGVPEPTSKLRGAPEVSAAYAAGLRGGDTVEAVNGKPVRTWSELHWEILQAVVAKRPADLDVRPAGGGALERRILSLDALRPDDLEGDFLHKLGLDAWLPPAKLEKIDDGSPAMLAGLHEGDVVSKVDGAFISDGLELADRIHAAPGKTLNLTVLRAGHPYTFNVTPQSFKSGDKWIGRIGVIPATEPELTTVREMPMKAASKAVGKTWDSSVLTIRMLGKMLTGAASMKNITGPITIADYAGKTASMGMAPYLGFIAFVSISLAVMNLLPVPVLDGGLLLYYSLEVLTGHPVSERFSEIAQRAGIGILMALMAVAIFNDIARLMS